MLQKVLDTKVPVHKGTVAFQDGIRGPFYMDFWGQSRY